MLRVSPVTSWNPAPGLPEVHPSSFVDESAVVIGQVVLNPRVIVCPTVVLRADEGFPIEIGEGTNVQDGVIMHCLKDSHIQVGADCSVAHGAVIHGPCTIENNCFVGFRATLKGVHVGPGCFIGHHALLLDVKVPPGRYVPSGCVVSTQAQADELPLVTQEHTDFNAEVLAVNNELRMGYLNQITLNRADVGA